MKRSKKLRDFEAAKKYLELKEVELEVEIMEDLLTVFNQILKSEIVWENDQGVGINRRTVPSSD